MFVRIANVTSQFSVHINNSYPLAAYTVFTYVDLPKLKAIIVSLQLIFNIHWKPTFFNSQHPVVGNMTPTDHQFYQ